MKIITPLLLLAVVVVSSCGPSSAEMKLQHIQDSLRQAEEVKKAVEDAKAEMNASQTAASASASASGVQSGDITSKITTFYQRSFKAMPILPMTAPSFDSALRNCQARSGYNGVKGTVSYMLWQNWLNASDRSITSFTPVCGEVNSTDATHASCAVTLRCNVSAPEGNLSVVFNDRFEFLKVGGTWKIDDIVRDGQSLKAYWSQNNVYIP